MVAPTLSNWAPAASAVFQTLGFTPWPEQAAILSCTKPYILVTGGEQGGKSLISTKKFHINWLADMAKWQRCYTPASCNGHPDGRKCDPTLLYWLIGADYIQTTEEFRYIEGDFHTLGFTVNSSKDVDPGFIEIIDSAQRVPRLRIETKTARDPTKIARQAPHGIMVCEAGQTGYDIYERCRGRTAPKDAWLFLIGTIEKTQPWFPRLKEQWKFGHTDRQSFELPSYANLTLYPGGKDDPKIQSLKSESSDEFYMERIEGKPVPPTGLVFPEFGDAHTSTEATYVPGAKVYLAEDPGYGGSAHALYFCHIIDEQLIVFDGIHERGLVVEEIITAAKQMPFYGLSEKAYYSDPHYSNAHHSKGSIAEAWQDEAGLPMLNADRRVPLLDGLEVMRSRLKLNPIDGKPRIIINPKCQSLLAEFGLVPWPEGSPHADMVDPYRWKLDSSGEHIGTTPVDRNCDGIKALIYLLTGMYGTGKPHSNKLKVINRLRGRR